MTERKRKFQIAGLLLFATFLVGLEGQCKNTHHPVAANEGQRARNSLRHKLDLLHRAEGELLQKQAAIERQIDTVKHQISETERALRIIESVLHHM
ncbi:MAG: hypothetical protein K2X93_13355 [Candidatus Obscuribacterales bacterium]|nr:hypothetical protein [Candidatus Obscuribacterales bacterium]